MFKAPFPYFGGKSRIAPLVWQALGDVRNYVEPFFGSGAALLLRPDFNPVKHLETVNDKDGLIANFWRALQRKPDEVAYYADHPVNENDLHARHAWLVGQKDSLQTRLEGDPDCFDVKIAGWWVWGMACWIGAGFCSGKGSWQVIDGQLVHLGSAGRGIQRQLVHLGNAGQGIHRQRVHLGSAGQGIHRQRVHLGDAGSGEQGLYAWFEALAERLRRVRVCCGDWTRVCGPTPTVKQGLTGVFLDPPYALAERDKDIYRVDKDISAQVREWAIKSGDDPRLRIVLCGYDGEHAMPDTWREVAWKAHGGYGSQSKSGGRGKPNSSRERLWLSPHCNVLEEAA